jgi:hypothetical protein
LQPAAPSPLQSLPVSAAAVATGGVESSDVSASSDRDQSSMAIAHKAAAAVTKPGLQIRTSSSKSKPVSPVATTTTTAPVEEHRRGITLPPAAADSGAAVDSPDTAAGRGGSTSHTASHMGSTYSTIRHQVTAGRRVSISEGSGSQPGSARSPRRNWRSAFVFSDSDDETEPHADQGLGGLTGTGGPWGSADHTAALAGVIRTTPFGVLNTDPQVAEFGMYAKVLAPGATTAGAGAGIGTFGIGPHGSTAGAGRGPAKQLAGAAGVGVKPSAYVPGAMREVSLVALGGGGVVLRLEAHEMNSMWDQE